MDQQAVLVVGQFGIGTLPKCDHSIGNRQAFAFVQKIEMTSGARRPGKKLH
jgi:hypothetical protein